MKRFTTFILSMVLVLTGLCSCSAKTGQPETSIVYIGPDGERLERPYESAFKKNKEPEDDDERYEDQHDDKDYGETEPAFDEEAEIEKAIQKAEKLLSEGKHDAALASLIEVKNRCSDRSRIIEEENRIESFRPVEIFGLEPMMYTDDDDLEIIRWKSSRKINTGESGKSGIGCTTHEQLSLCSYPGRTHAVASVDFSYYVNGKYDQLSGLFVLGAETLEHSNTPMSISLNIYSDDVLIYASEEITRGSLPIPINVDIPNGSQIVKIQFVSSTTNLKNGISTSTQYSAALVDALFSKKYVPLS